ncbi:hypothetical protein [Rhodocyclus gracilis]|uniref:Uncharacterized protein n=1 Tax=Rhodocyclus tenuis TaxID=1066 RepID=A0A6L5JUS3_RHOTE|nr:hypothetical protein [Rhodocyclus gracilis]MQY50836.1 hypothetical protein [Rhodocyclus gracilis]
MSNDLYGFNLTKPSDFGLNYSGMDSSPSYYVDDPLPSFGSDSTTSSSSGGGINWDSIINNGFPRMIDAIGGVVKANNTQPVVINGQRLPNGQIVNNTSLNSLLPLLLVGGVILLLVK